MARDRSVIERRLRLIRQQLQHDPDRGVALLRESIPSIEQSCREYAARRATVPPLRYPEALPIVQARQEIMALLSQHSVVIICGETGSGKTTQLPKLCLELGRGVAGMIGLTQPRRIAARAMADFLARDLTSAEGATGQIASPIVGYKIRFNDHSAASTLIKVMTDGILLAETLSDRLLLAYDTLIIDEAHERSLNIDFLLGYLKQIRTKRPDLKLIISSATLDADKLAHHFDDAPVLNVSGRLYPVEVRYRPPQLMVEETAADSDPEQLREQTLLRAVDELCGEGSGDVLIFLPGEREIRDTAEALRKHHPPGVTILPLYARLSAAEQQRIFQPAPKRRLILATNIAETSITVPGIRYVVDGGLARISRYSGRTQIQRLPVEKISRSSADQRKGRCGRLSDGICIRLYSEEDYLDRPAFTDPEILRSSLAAVILRMKLLRLGAIEQFPLIDSPPSQAIRDGERLLQELGALDEDNQLTAIGSQLAALPLDPRIGRMVLAARTHDCVTELLVIGAALDLQDPRERPQEKRQVADESHRRFSDPRSDFVAWLNLWQFITTAQRTAKSKNKFRTFLKDNFLSSGRVREWFDVHEQLSRQVREMGFRLNTVPASYEALHQAILTGLLGHVGVRQQKRDYLAARNNRLVLASGSGLYQKPPEWIMAAEMVLIHQLQARQCAAIEPAWIEAVAGSLCRKVWSDPYWDSKRGQTMVHERVMLYGLTLISDRRVHYGPINPAVARDLLIRSGLVAGAWRPPLPVFLVHNQQLVAEVRDLEQRIRRCDLLVDDEALVAFYDERIPADITTAQLLEQWRRRLGRRQQRLLHFSRELLLRQATDSSLSQYPGHLTIDGDDYTLEYHFNPGQQDDGISVLIPLPLLNRADANRFDWLVPGLLRAKILSLFKALPQSERRKLVPLPDRVDHCLQHLTPDNRTLVAALDECLRQTSNIAIPAASWQPQLMPEHLQMNFKIMDEDRSSTGGGTLLAQGRDLAALRQQLGGQARERFSLLAQSQFERHQLRHWDFGLLPTKVALTVGGRTVDGYPALRDEGDSVSLMLLESEQQATQVMPTGLRRLFLLNLVQPMRGWQKWLPVTPAMCQDYLPLGRCDNLRRDLLLLLVDRLFVGDDPLAIRDAAAFQARLEQGCRRFQEEARPLCRLVEQILTEYRLLKQRLHQSHPVRQQAEREVTAQLNALWFKGALLATPAQWLIHLPRYFKAMQLRLERCVQAPLRDRARATELEPLQQFVNNRLLKQDQQQQPIGPELIQLRWLLEEWRVSLFAQELRTIVPVSRQKLELLRQRIETGVMGG
ncbi:MAG: ATP-dependent RNA helicase HrpA [Magnetococcales bacterium]|nr:ATP-dependent RNA helicase HrpA [Magnetococcales bacterium]